MSPDANKRFSALAVIHQFNPTKATLDEAVRRALNGVNDGAAAIAIVRETQESLTAAGLYRPDLERVRLDVFHNPFAELPVDPGIFDEELDRQWGLLGSGYGMMEVARRRT